jgi:hypothetical protein
VTLTGRKTLVYVTAKDRCSRFPFFTLIQSNTRVMQNRHPIRLRSCLAAMVLFGSVAPPACEHSHAGGQAPHRHGAADGHDHDHAHHTEAHAVALNHSHNDDLQLDAAPTLHAHWSFLIFDLSWPVDEKDGRRPQPDELLDQALAQVRSAGAPTNNLADSAFLLPFVAMKSWAAHCVCDVKPARLQPLYQSLRHLLCDAARHERSGVQLI